jgi:hypothetical protein
MLSIHKSNITWILYHLTNRYLYVHSIREMSLILIDLSIHDILYLFLLLSCISFCTMCYANMFYVFFFNIF